VRTDPDWTIREFPTGSPVEYVFVMRVRMAWIKYVGVSIVIPKDVAPISTHALNRNVVAVHPRFYHRVVGVSSDYFQELSHIDNNTPQTAYSARQKDARSPILPNRRGSEIGGIFLYEISGH
jgi:hypothetical protein